MLQLSAGREASSGGVVRNERHRPEQTLLCQLVGEYYPAFEARWADEGKALPDYVRLNEPNLPDHVQQRDVLCE